VRHDASFTSTVSLEYLFYENLLGDGSMENIYANGWMRKRRRHE
jgi:hypothetical protein